MSDKDHPTRRELKQRVQKVTKEIQHSDQTALGISTDDAMDAIKRGQEGSK